MRSLLPRRGGARRTAALLLTGAALALSPLAGAGSATATLPVDRLEDTGCLSVDTGAGATEARGGHGLDHPEVSPAEQRAIEARTAAILNTKRQNGAATLASVTVPVYVHVMRDTAGNGDVTNAQIRAQIRELNENFAGGESSEAAETEFTFTLEGTFRYNNDAWHQDKQSTKYRKETRKGGMDALNMWLVDFAYLGIATFPWSGNADIDGIRVHYDSLPGGSIENFNLGKTATHEAGHWFGLYHTFQGGCSAKNDLVEDTPAQASPTSGCPIGRDSCEDPGLDPIHNYMDYSWDSCYNQFTPGQSTRMSDMWTAYRA
jgi:Pregnancy-associated plasma protein-A